MKLSKANMHDAPEDFSPAVFPCLQSVCSVFLRSDWLCDKGGGSDLLQSEVRTVTHVLLDVITVKVSALGEFRLGG